MTPETKKKDDRFRSNLNQGERTWIWVIVGGVPFRRCFGFGGWVCLANAFGLLLASSVFQRFAIWVIGLGHWNKARLGFLCSSASWVSVFLLGFIMCSMFRY